MTRPPRTRLGVSAVLSAACALAPGTAPVDADGCIVKVRPHPIADLDPAIAGCLIDDIGTKQVFLKNARPGDTVVGDDAGAAGGTDVKTTVRISGREIVQVLTTYDGNGAPVWEKRDADTFQHEGDPARTRTALETLSSKFCSRQTQAAGPAPPAEDPGAGAEATARVIGVDEAFRLSEEGRIVLIDVRLESEWRETGIAATAIPITMHQRMDDFVKRIGEAAGADNQTPIAFICAHGERSSYLQRELAKYGFDRIIDVHGGMLGGKRAPGWIGSGLPVRPYDPTP